MTQLANCFESNTSMTKNLAYGLYWQYLTLSVFLCCVCKLLNESMCWFVMLGIPVWISILPLFLLSSCGDSIKIILECHFFLLLKLNSAHDVTQKSGIFNNELLLWGSIRQTSSVFIFRSLHNNHDGGMRRKEKRTEDRMRKNRRRGRAGREHWRENGLYSGSQWHTVLLVHNHPHTKTQSSTVHTNVHKSI